VGQGKTMKLEGGKRIQGVRKQSLPNQPLISVITVVFNGKEYLDKAIQSVLGQSYRNIEYIVIDGGSTDGTLDIINKFGDSIDYWLSEPDSGIYDAMNKGIELAGGELIGMLNADDYYEKDALTSIVKTYQQKNGVNIYFGDTLIIQDDLGIKFRWSSNLRYWRGMSIIHQSMFVHQRVYSAIGKYDLNSKFAADYDFFLRAIKNKIAFIPTHQIIVNYRNTGRTAENLWISLNEARGVNKKYFGVISIDHCRFLFFFGRALFFIGLQKVLQLLLGKKLLNKARKIYITKILNKD
jgi:glycosyltransferase involved in cell wall biosynthesis